MSEQRVAKRKTHTKSRRGCLQCKQRHTKCNEARPRCANCSRLVINCSWPSVTDVYPASPHPSPGDQTSPVVTLHPSESPGSVQAQSNLELSMPDMRLLHHWTFRGYKALHPNLAMRSDNWQNGVVEIGFDHPFLLHGLLALSAVHKASFLVPLDRQNLLFQADMHISQALDTMRKHLEAPKFETAIPMFVLSSVLLTYNFGSVQEQPEDPIGSLHHCFMLLNGIKLVIGQHWDKIKDSPVIIQMIGTSAPATVQELAELAKNDTCFEIIRLVELTELVLDTQDKAACVEAIEELHSVAVRFRHIRLNQDEYTFLFLWPARMTPRFSDLLAAHNPVACIVTVHFAALLAEARPVWWVVKWPRYLLNAAEQLLAATPDLLKWLVWPQNIINSAPVSAAATPGAS